MIEYHIPTRSKIWGNTSNPLKFAIDHRGSIYFTEWTENKIGILKSNSINKIPLFMNVSESVIELNSKKEDKGEIIHISLYNTKMNNYSKTDLPKFEVDDGKVEMFVSSSISKSGQLWNITSNFSNDKFLLSDISSDIPYNLTLEIKPEKNLISGNYTLTVSARYENTITYSKIIDIMIR